MRRSVCAQVKFARCVDCRATIGEVGNGEPRSASSARLVQSLAWYSPDGAPISMNPVDHPMGGRTNNGGGRHHPVSPWGQKAKGLKTRTNKRTDSMIVRTVMRPRRVNHNGTFR